MKAHRVEIAPPTIANGHLTVTGLPASSDGAPWASNAAEHRNSFPVPHGSGRRPALLTLLAALM